MYGLCDWGLNGSYTRGQDEVQTIESLGNSVVDDAANYANERGVFHHRETDSELTSNTTQIARAYHPRE